MRKLTSTEEQPEDKRKGLDDKTKQKEGVMYLLQELLLLMMDLGLASKDRLT